MKSILILLLVTLLATSTLSRTVQAAKAGQPRRAGINLLKNAMKATNAAVAKTAQATTAQAAKVVGAAKANVAQATTAPVAQATTAPVAQATTAPVAQVVGAANANVAKVAQATAVPATPGQANPPTAKIIVIKEASEISQHVEAIKVKSEKAIELFNKSKAASELLLKRVGKHLEWAKKGKEELNK